MIAVVIPTIGRPSLADTLAAVGAGLDVIVVDDRPCDPPSLDVPEDVRVVRCYQCGHPADGLRAPAPRRTRGPALTGTEMRGARPSSPLGTSSRSS